MHEAAVKVKILIDTLNAKKKLLSQVYSITENQESILLSGDTSDEISLLFNGMCEEKQSLIDQILRSDTVFEKTFFSISGIFEQFAEENKEIAKTLQQGVKDVMDLDVKIRVLERRNREIAGKYKQGKVIDIPKASKEHVLSQYKKYNSKLE